MFEVSLPPKILAGGSALVAEYLFLATPIGEFVRKPWVRRILAEDIVLLELQPWVHCFLPYEHEDDRLDEWAKLRPDIHAKASVMARESLTQQSFTLTNLVGQRRLKIRLAAMRKIDATLAGEESFHQAPELGNMPHILVDVPGFTHRFAIGKASQARYSGNAVRDAEVLECIASPDRIRGVERVMAAFWPDPVDDDTPTAWYRIMEKMDLVKDIRAWEMTKKIPFMNGTWWYDLASLPDGIAIRTPAAEVLHELKHESAFTLLNALGVSTFLPQVVVDYLAVKNIADQVAAYAENQELGLDLLKGSEFVQNVLTKTKAA